MFYDARKFDQDISDLDVSQVTYMRQMFERAYEFNGNIGSWDTSSVTNMEYMFRYSTALIVHWRLEHLKFEAGLSNVL